MNAEQTLTVVGACWGDEGKGKIVDILAEDFDIVARYSGGANAGHTVNGLVHHQIPSGVQQDKTCVIGRGCFFDSSRFIKERNEAEQALGKLPRILVDYGCPLWTPYHEVLEAYLEHVRGKEAIQTTKKAIGPIAGLYAMKLGPTTGDLMDKVRLLNRTALLYSSLSPILSEMSPHATIKSPADVVRDLSALNNEISPHLADTSFFLHHELNRGARLLAEGAQATGLDVHWGTWPFCSSGNSVAAGAPLGLGLPPGLFQDVLLVTKVFPTRVGAGPFPSEIWNRQSAENFPLQHPELFPGGDERAKTAFLQTTLEKINAKQASRAEFAQYLQVLGYELGATTGRGRSVGYLDIPWLKYATRVNGAKWLALTRFDMLSGMKKIPVITDYNLRGKMLSAGEMPRPNLMNKIEPEIEFWDGWEENVSGITDEEHLPGSALTFLTRLRHYSLPVVLIGTGPARKDVIDNTELAEYLARA